jgi:hypothetical protein
MNISTAISWGKKLQIKPRYFKGVHEKNYLVLEITWLCQTSNCSNLLANFVIGLLPANLNQFFLNPFYFSTKI